MTTCAFLTLRLGSSGFLRTHMSGTLAIEHALRKILLLLWKRHLLRLSVKGQVVHA